MKRQLIGIAVVLALASCDRERREHEPDAPQPSKSERLEAEVPLGQGPTAEEIERERFNSRWRELQSFRDALAARLGRGEEGSIEAERGLQFLPRGESKESFEGLEAARIDDLPLLVPISGDVAGPSVLRVQVLLDRVGFSPGIIDGRWGKNSEIALYWFQRENGLAPTGSVDEPTFRTLFRKAGGAPTLVQRPLTQDDVKGPFVKIPADVYEQEMLDCLCYESPGEKLAEMAHMSAELLALLNRDMSLDAPSAGQVLVAPNVRPPLQQSAARGIERLVVSVEGNYLHALDAAGNVLFHAPTTVGSEYDPSPQETVTIKAIAHDPHFHYQPRLFHEVPDENPEAHLKPGPNSPVGVVWIALSKRHYGIHGTSDPASIGYASSHGCVRLTNWDAHDLAHQVRSGMSVAFVDPRPAGG
ncbi:MAG TPA: L,D-transpeptidase [Thermoanaerobaculia bacterium]|nr:L,D-transpeptidase [Thermoanaerobaculia bacterium]